MSGQLHLFEESPDLVKACRTSPLLEASVVRSAQKRPNLYLGTSSWSFPGWHGLVYEREHTAAELAHSGLRAYSEIPLLRTVSLDRTYYKPMRVEEYRQLAEQVPSGFRFVVKAPRDLLKPSSDGIDFSQFTRSFLKPTIEGLGEHLGVVLLQFPPGTAAEFSGKFLPALSRFVSRLPREQCYSLEVREADLLGAELTEALEGSPVSLCGSIHSSLPGLVEQFSAVPPNAATPIVFRWNIRPSLDYEAARNLYKPFRSLQSEDPGRRSVLVRLLDRALKAGRDVYMTANNKAEGCAPLTLLKVLEELSFISQ